MVKHYVVIHGPIGVKEDTLEIKGSMLRDLIETLSQKYGRDFHRLTINSKTGRLQRGVLVSINGVDARLIGDLRAKLSDGDVVTFLPPVAGG
jgi:MoaD family protein